MIQRGKEVEMVADNLASVDSGLPVTVLACRWKSWLSPPSLKRTNSGELQIPAGALGAGPRARFRLEHEGDALRLIPEAPHALWETLPPHERARTFRDWVTQLPKRRGPAIPAEALRRENLYD